jgi:hypothetical protein
VKLDIQVLHDGGKQLILRLEASEKRTLRGEVVAFMLLPALLPIPVFHQTGSVVACAIAMHSSQHFTSDRTCSNKFRRNPI